MNKANISREAFIDKYKEYTFTPQTEGLRVVLSEINKYLDLEENGSFTHQMYEKGEVSAIMAKIDRSGALRGAFQRYANLAAWLTQTRLRTILLLKLSYALLMQVDEMVNAMLKAETIEYTLRDKGAEDLLSDLQPILDSMTLLRFTYYEHDEINYYAMKDSISDGIMYGKAYEKAVELISKEIGVPEAMVFVTDDLEKTEKLLSAIRGNLERLQEFVDLHDFESDTEKAMRCRTIQILSAPMASDNAISSEGVVTARAMIRGLKAFNTPTNGIIHALMVKEFSTDN